ncbi:MULTISPECIES: DNA/RNA nuclease SfsA [Chelativorans]|jgi:sugar fermentation stimulation protein A|uniref:Sugar fermentation stimulation protein homolog n=1 Tax=Chelativorans sp. (strain BNC1) TaxID=266779 RepID=SFSA_CHESB|nr:MULTISPECIES: DNA/RNA nuclease SfsA [Chelativorans]Q11IC3.1 RecName: Full=Sugar fermentation stimulation protein homolog [Chelativorans sp. BNC1]
MIFPSPLTEARLIRRYKRFLADVVLADGTELTVSVPNTGSMLGLTAPGSRVLLSKWDDPKRKYPYRLEIVEADGTLVGINTGLPNRLAAEAIRARLVGDLGTYPVIRPEQRYGERSRIDFLLEHPERPPAYVEVKNVHFMREAGLAEFPDTRTDRGARHLDELAAMRRAGNRAVMIYVVQRADCSRFRLCADLDASYAAAFGRARDAGVEAFVIGCQISADAIAPDRLIDLDF